MLWLTLRQLRNGSVGTRKKAARELWKEQNPAALGALATATLEDSDAEVRKAAATALGTLPTPGRYEPLIRALQDRNAEVVISSLSGLRRCSDPKVIQALVAQLRHADFSVRSAAAQSIDTIRWVPANREERIWFQVAKGWYERAAAVGSEALTPLQLTVQTGPVHAAARAVSALGAIPDERVVRVLCTAIKSEEPVVCIAGADALGRVGGSVAVESLITFLRSHLPQLRVACVQALGNLEAAEATSLICKMLKDKEWEVRQESAVALGKLNNVEALDPLAETLDDTDADVREAAAMALAKIGHRRSILPLVMALKDEVASVRRVAAAGLSRIDPDWVSLPETRAAAEKLKMAIQDAEPAVRFFVSQLLVNMGELSPDAIAGFKPEDQLASPAIKRKRMATRLFITLMQESDRDIRQAAAEALGRLGGDRARQALTMASSDTDGDVAAAAQMALQALGTETKD